MRHPAAEGVQGVAEGELAGPSTAMHGRCGMHGSAVAPKLRLLLSHAAAAATAAACCLSLTLPPCQEPVPHIQAHPLPNNLLEWHFVLEGAKCTDFEGGLYHGKLVFPPNYPFKPPSISIFTPNGRFAVNTKLCLSITDFHPESWNPMCELLHGSSHMLALSCDSQHSKGQAWHAMAPNHHCKGALQAPGVATYPNSQHAAALCQAAALLHTSTL